MNHLQEWVLQYLLGREGASKYTKGKDLFAASYNVTREDLQGLLDGGFIALEQTTVLSSWQDSISLSTLIRLTEKGRDYVQPKNQAS